MREQPGAEVAGRLEEMATVAKESVDDLRSTVCAMNRESLTTQEIMTRLEQNVRRLPEGLGSTDVKFDHTGEERILPQAVGLALYCMSQEALNNALKYAKAKEIRISVGVSPTPKDDANAPAVSVIVRDNGVGFDPEQVVLGSGLEGMCRRAERHGIKYSLHSTSGTGTEVQMKWYE